MHYARSVSRALHFIRRPARWLPFFIADLLFLAFFLSLIFSYSYPETIPFSETLFIEPASTAAAGFSFTLLFGFALWSLALVWIGAAVVHQSWKGNEFRGSFGIATGLIITVLASVLLAQFIGGFLTASSPPYGSLLALLFWIFSAYIMQALVIDRKGPISAIESSFSIVRKNFIPVILFSILLLIVAGIVFLIFGIWFIALFILLIFQNAASISPENSLPAIISILKQNINTVTLTLILMAIGHAITTAFTLKAQTEFYLGLTRKGLVRNFFRKR